MILIAHLRALVPTRAKRAIIISEQDTIWDGSEGQELLLHLISSDFLKRGHFYVSESSALSNIKTHQVIVVCNSSCAN